MVAVRRTKNGMPSGARHEKHEVEPSTFQLLSNVLASKSTPRNRNHLVEWIHCATLNSWNTWRDRPKDGWKCTKTNFLRAWRALAFQLLRGMVREMVLSPMLLPLLEDRHSRRPVNQVKFYYFDFPIILKLIFFVY